ncbi:MAG: carboxypeptidase-like regulatory domain-containing protein [Rhizobacter sp.]|nr:carboxypeptidase-like regulatory domain-containing protein [Ferruginibacter sp.]
MRSLSLYIIACFLCTYTYAQQAFKGKVLSAETDIPLNGVSVYFNNTSIGTLTNEKGEFIIPVAIEGEVIISSVGFERIIYKTSKEGAGQKSFTFKLQPKETILQDVLILPDASRKKYLKLFRDHFLGITEEADMSRITNLGAIYFVKSPTDKDGIIALSDTPLTIINRQLGYTINFDLGEFYLNEKQGRTSFYGFTRYNEMGDRKKWAKNRRKAYYGSTVHFFRSLITNTLEREGYSIYKIKSDSLKKRGNPLNISANKVDMAIPVKATDIIEKDSASNFYSAKWGAKLMVQYHKKTASQDYLYKKILVKDAFHNGFRAYLNTSAGFIRIDTNGLLEDPMAVYYSGYWIYEKAANLLPYNYNPEKEDK